MPVYEYRCNSCQHKFTIYQTLKEKAETPNPSCPKCGKSDVTYVFSPINIITESKSEREFEDFESKPERPEEEEISEPDFDEESPEEFEM